MKKKTWSANATNIITLGPFFLSKLCNIPELSLSNRVHVEITQNIIEGFEERVGNEIDSIMV